MSNGVDYVRKICKSRKIPVSALEKACGFSNGYLNPKKLNKIPYDRALLIADYLDIDIQNILGVASEPQLTARDERDIAKDLDNIMGKIRSGEDGPLRYNGEEIDEESLQLLEDAISMSLRHLKIINKEKYNPYKNKKK